MSGADEAEASRHFVAVTDSGTALDASARERGSSLAEAAVETARGRVQRESVYGRLDLVDPSDGVLHVVMGRPALFSDRELLTFAFLASLGGCDAQVRGHVAGNINVGNDRARLMAVLTVLIPFIGYPRTLNALQAVDAIAPADQPA